MSRYNPPSLFERFFQYCLGAFVAALLLYVAVQIVASIKWWLIGGLLVVGLASCGVAFLRFHRERW
jgi:cell division protein FtsW (lipid II flippase)